MIPKMKIRRLFEPLISTIYAFLPRNNAEMQIELLHRQGTIVKVLLKNIVFTITVGLNIATIWQIPEYGKWLNLEAGNFNYVDNIVQI